MCDQVPVPAFIERSNYEQHTNTDLGALVEIMVMLPRSAPIAFRHESAETICHDIGTHLNLCRPIEENRIWRGGEKSSTSLSLSRSISTKLREKCPCPPVRGGPEVRTISDTEVSEAKYHRKWTGGNKKITYYTQSPRTHHLTPG